MLTRDGCRQRKKNVAREQREEKGEYNGFVGKQGAVEGTAWFTQ